MKEISDIKSEKIEVHQEVNQQKEYKLIGQMQLKTGCKLWGFNPETQEMKEIVTTAPDSLTINGEPLANRKADYNHNLIYVQAINKKNAAKKVLKLLTISV